MIVVRFVSDVDDSGSDDDDDDMMRTGVVVVMANSHNNILHVLTSTKNFSLSNSRTMAFDQMFTSINYSIAIEINESETERQSMEGN